MTYSAITIADEILKTAKRSGVKLTPLQLMKLVYIAHGWSLAVRNQDLFKNRIEAWKYGPVIPDLYQATKHFGRNAIPHERITDDPSGVDSDTQIFLEDVFSKYGRLSGYALSNLTHQSGTPWERAYKEGVMGVEIPDEPIKDHYLRLLDERRDRPAAAAGA